MMDTMLQNQNTNKLHKTKKKSFTPHARKALLCSELQAFVFIHFNRYTWVNTKCHTPLSVRQPRVQLFFLHILATDLISRFKTLIYFQVKTRFTFSMCAFFPPKVF